MIVSTRSSFSPRHAMNYDPQHHTLQLRDSQVHYVTAGEGRPVVLLHGWPQTWYAWRKIMTPLSRLYRVIAPDLRGLGDSSRPTSGFDKKTVARDIADLLQALGISSAYVVGHDWGGPVAFALAAFHPGLVSKLVMLDAAVPGDGSGTFSQQGRRWHHALHQTAELPEQLIRGREDIYLGWFYHHYGQVAGAISPEDEREYLRTYARDDTTRTGLAYYRALEQDVKDNAAFLEHHRLTMPVLAYGGAQAFGRGGETLSSLQRVASRVEGGVVEQCGHWIPEEQPEFITGEMIRFFETN
jgi:pimeloyl-ACP methyl ester carboxylesterase